MCRERSAYNPASGVVLAAGTQTLGVTFTPADTTVYTTATAAVSLTVHSAIAPLLITTNTLLGGTAGALYFSTLTATGGTTPYSWSIVSGSLPLGLLLIGTGTISGIPAEEVTSNFTVQVTDANNSTATQSLSIFVTPLLTYSARTDNCVNGTQSGCIAKTTTGEAGASLVYREGVNDPIPAGFGPATITSGSCPTGLKPSTYPANCPAPMNTSSTDPDFGAYLVIATDDSTNAPNTLTPYKVAWHLGSDGEWDAFSWDETLLLAHNTAGGATILNVNPAAIHAHTWRGPGCVNSSGIYNAQSGSGDSTHLAFGGSWSFSRVASEPHVLYELSSVPTQVNQVTVNSSIASPGSGTLSRNIYVDFTSDSPVPCSVVESAAPGNPTTYASSWDGDFEVADDGTISYGLTGGYDWAQSWTVTPVDTFILPTAGNSGKYGFQATAITGSGVTGISEPFWCQTAGCTVTDGGVTWTNIDKLNGQGPGFDVLIYRPAGTVAAGCTRINTRLGKIYRGTGNSAPAGYMTTNDQVACTRAGTYPSACSMPDRFTLHEVGQSANSQFVGLTPPAVKGQIRRGAGIPERSAANRALLHGWERIHHLLAT